LTAAHVFIASETRPDTIEMNGTMIIQYMQYNQTIIDAKSFSIHFGDEIIQVKRVIIHPNYLEELTKGTCDIAIVEFEAPIKGLKYPNLNTAFDEINCNVIGVGFGSSGPADKPELVKSLKNKIAGENVIDSIAGEKYMDLETLLICDFDHPTRNDCNKIGSATPRPLEYLFSGGDSGGGLFRYKGTKWELIGIGSSYSVEIRQFKKTGYYGQLMSWTRVSVFDEWIKQNIK